MDSMDGSSSDCCEMLPIRGLNACVAKIVNIYLQQVGWRCGTCSWGDDRDSHELFNRVIREANVVIDKMLSDVASTLCDGTKV